MVVVLDMRRRALVRAANLPVDLADLAHPLAALGVLQVEHRVTRPVEVVGDEGYLLAEAVEGVAYDSPAGATPWTSK